MRDICEFTQNIQDISAEDIINQSKERNSGLMAAKWELDDISANDMFIDIYACRL
jgi:hypothetical protein